MKRLKKIKEEFANSMPVTKPQKDTTKVSSAKSLSSLKKGKKAAPSPNDYAAVDSGMPIGGQ